MKSLIFGIPFFSKFIIFVSCSWKLLPRNRLQFFWIVFVSTFCLCRPSAAPRGGPGGFEAPQGWSGGVQAPRRVLLVGPTCQISGSLGPRGRLEVATSTQFGVLHCLRRPFGTKLKWRNCYFAIFRQHFHPIVDFSKPFGRTKLSS